MLHQLVAGALLALAGLFTTAAHAQANTAGGTLHWSASRPLVLVLLWALGTTLAYTPPMMPSP